MIGNLINNVIPCDATDDASVSSSNASSEYDEPRLKLEIETLVMTEDAEQQLRIAHYIKSCLSQEPVETREAVVQYGLVPRLVEFLKQPDNSSLQFYSSWILTCLTDGGKEHTNIVIQNEAIPILCSLLASDVEVVKNQAIWALAGIVDSVQESREMILGQGILGHLLDILSNDSSLHTTKPAIFCLSILCRGQLPPGTQILPALRKLLTCSNFEILMDTCWTLLNFLQHVDEKTKAARISSIIENGLAKGIGDLVCHRSDDIVHPGMMLLKEITFCDPKLLDKLLEDESEVLRSLDVVLCTKSREVHIHRLATETAVNLTEAATTSQMEKLMEAKIIEYMAYELMSQDPTILTHSVIAIHEATLKLDGSHVLTFLCVGCLGPLCQLLGHPNPHLLIYVLKGIYNIVTRVGNKEFCSVVNKYDPLLLPLQKHPNKSTSEVATEIVKYFAKQ